MKKIVVRLLFAAALFAPPAIYAQAAAGSLSIEGDIPAPIHFTAEQLNAMGKISIHKKDMGGTDHEYSGVAVMDILKAAGIIQPAFNRDNLTKYLLVRGADNYQVLFSVSELDSTFSGHMVILASSMDGQPLPNGKGPYRIVIPGEEKRQARNIFSVTSFIIRNAKD